MSADRIARGLALLTRNTVSAVDQAAIDLAMRQASRVGPTRNALFGEWASATSFPRGWSDNGSVTTPTRVAGDSGPYAMSHVGNAAGTASMYQDIGSTTVRALRPSQKWRFSADVRLESGALTGAGLYFDVRDSSNGLLENWSLVLSTDLDTTGVAPGAGTAGVLYRYIKDITLGAGATIFWARFQCNTHAAVHGSIAGANSLTWFRAGIEPRP